MDVKILEIRDEHTFIPVLCIDMNHPYGHSSHAADAQAWRAEAYYLRRCGYPLDGRPNIAMTSLDMDGGRAWNDPYGWPPDVRTYPVAHNYIIDHWRELRSGDVVDVQFILGETAAPKVSERLAQERADES